MEAGVPPSPSKNRGWGGGTTITHPETVQHLISHGSALVYAALASGAAAEHLPGAALTITLSLFNQGSIHLSAKSSHPLMSSSIRLCRYKGRPHRANFTENYSWNNFWSSSAHLGTETQPSTLFWSLAHRADHLCVDDMPDASVTQQTLSQ